MKEQYRLWEWEIGWLLLAVAIVAIPAVVAVLFPVLDIIFVPGEEHWLTLLRDPHHLLFEAITGLVQMMVLDVLILAFVWPAVKRHIHKDVEEGVERGVGWEETTT